MKEYFIFNVWVIVYYLYQKRLVETICFSKTVKPNILLRKIKQKHRKRKKKEVRVKYHCRNDRWWEICVHPTFDLWNFVNNDPLLHEISKFWKSITVLKLLRALSKYSTRSSDHLNLVFKSVSAADTCSLMLLAILFFHQTFPHSNFVILLFFINLRMLIDRPDWTITWGELARSAELARFSKTSQCSSTHVIVKQFQQSLLMIAVLVLKWCRIAYRAANKPLTSCNYSLNYNDNNVTITISRHVQKPCIFNACCILKTLWNIMLRTPA